MSRSRPALMNMSSYFIATSSSAASSPIAPESPGMPIASGKPNSRMSVEPSSFDAASTSQGRLKGAHLGGLMKEQRGDPVASRRRRKFRRSDNPAAGTWYSKGEPVAQNNKGLGGNALHTEPVLQLTMKVKRIRKRHGTTSFKYRRTHRTTLEAVFSMARKMLWENKQAILWKICM